LARKIPCALHFPAKSGGRENGSHSVVPRQLAIPLKTARNLAQSDISSSARVESKIDTLKAVFPGCLQLPGDDGGGFHVAKGKQGATSRSLVDVNSEGDGFKNKSMASRTFFNASSRVLPCDQQLFSAGQCAT